ncbi:MAG: hypothetical protein AAB656_03390 [Patescibacteria group bacterium]
MKKGQSMFEVVVALAIMTLILVALVSLAGISIRNSTFSKNRTSSTRINQETMEWLRGERDSGWAAFSQKALSGTWCLPALSWAQAQIGTCGTDSGAYIPGELFRREVVFSSVSATNIEVLVRVYWTDSQGQHETRATTNLTNWKNQ